MKGSGSHKRFFFLHRQDTLRNFNIKLGGRGVNLSHHLNIQAVVFFAHHGVGCLICLDIIRAIEIITNVLHHTSTCKRSFLFAHRGVIYNLLPGDKLAKPQSRKAAERQGQTGQARPRHQDGSLAAVFAGLEPFGFQSVAQYRAARRQDRPEGARVRHGVQGAPPPGRLEDFDGGCPQERRRYAPEGPDDLGEQRRRHH